MGTGFPRPAPGSFPHIPDFGCPTLAAAAGAVRAEVDAEELLLAGLRLATPASDGDTAQARRMVALLVDGLRYRASAPGKTVT